MAEKMVTVRLKRPGPMSYMGPGIKEPLKRGEIAEVPEAAFEQNEELGKIVDIISRGFELIHKPVLRLVLPDSVTAVHWIFIKLRALMARCGAEQFDAIIQSPGKTPGPADSFVRAHPDVRHVTHIEPCIQVPVSGFLVGGDKFEFDYALDPSWLAEARMNQVGDNHGFGEIFMEELPCDWHYLRTWSEFFDPPKQKRNAVAFLMGADGGRLNRDEWRELAEQISQTGAKPFAVGLPEHRAFADEVASGTGGTIINKIRSQDTFSDAIKLMRECRGVIGAGADLQILAGQGNIRTVGIFDRTRKGRILRILHAPMRFSLVPYDQPGHPYSARSIADEVTKRFQLDTLIKSKVDSLEESSTKDTKGHEEPSSKDDLQSAILNPQSLEAPGEPSITIEMQLMELQALMVERGKSEAQLLKKAGTKCLADITPQGYRAVRTWLIKSRKVKK